jgi:hypothetical protein
MKYVLLTLAVVALFAGQALATDGNVSQNMLSKMGLSGMKVMSDTQGTAIRGMGFVAVSGSSTVRLGFNVATDNYIASGHCFAVGGTVRVLGAGLNTTIGPWVATAGGAIAVAH